MKRAIITSKDVISLGVILDQVTAKAEFFNDDVRLQAEHTVNLESGYSLENGTLAPEHITELHAGSQLAISGAIAKLQAIVDAWFGPFVEEGADTPDARAPLVLDKEAFLKG